MASSTSEKVSRFTTKSEDRIKGHITNQDRGWAWVIAFAGLVVVFLGVGVYRSLGILLVEVIDVYDASTSQAALILSFAGIGMCLSAAVFILGLGDIFHERALLVASGLLAALGFISTSMSTKIEEIYFQGFCTGASMQTGLICASTMAGKYFKKRFSLAMGLIMAGVSLATIVLPPFVQWLFDEFTYKGAALILAGVSLNILVCSALMRPKTTNNTTTSAATECGTEQTEMIDLSDPKREINHVPGVSELSEIDETSTEISTKSSNNEGDSMQLYETKCLVPQNVKSDGRAGTGKTRRSFCSAVFTSIKQFALQSSMNKTKKVPARNTLKLSFTFFKDPSFILFECFIFLSTIASDSLIQFYPAFTKELGMSDYESAFLLSMVGGADLVGRLFFGWVGDCGFSERYKQLMIPQLILSASCFLLRFATVFWSQVIFAVVIGFNYGTSFGFRAVLLVDFFGLQSLSRRLGLTNFITGIANVTGNAILGALRDATGDFKLPLQLLGIIFFASGSSLLATGITKQCERRRHVKRRRNLVESSDD